MKRASSSLSAALGLVAVLASTADCKTRIVGFGGAGGGSTTASSATGASTTSQSATHAAATTGVATAASTTSQTSAAVTIASATTGATTTSSGGTMTGCNGALTCLNGCTTMPCQQACLANTTTHGQMLLSQLVQCISSACPTTNGGVCDTSSASYSQMNCSSCVDAATMPNAMCGPALAACANDLP